MATWMDLFWDAILGRGMKITFDKITSIEQNADAIVATVVGTEPYTVTIKKDFSEMSCTCPCEGYGIPSYMAASYYADSEGEAKMFRAASSRISLSRYGIKDEDREWAEELDKDSENKKKQ